MSATTFPRGAACRAAGRVSRTTPSRNLPRRVLPRCRRPLRSSENPCHSALLTLSRSSIGCPRSVSTSRTVGGPRTSHCSSSWRWASWPPEGRAACPGPEAEQKLADLIEEFGPTSKTGRAQSAAFPLTRLRSDGVWTLDRDVPMDKVSPLREGVTGAFEASLEAALRDRPELHSRRRHGASSRVTSPGPWHRTSSLPSAWTPNL